MSAFQIGFTVRDAVRAAWVFGFTYVSAFFTLAAGLGPVNNLSEAKAAVVALAPACLAAAFGAVKNLVLRDGTTIKG